MGLTSKAADAKANNVVGEGEAPATFNVADGKGEWFAAKSPFPLIDTESGTRFEGGVPTRATRTTWIQRQIDAGAMQEVEQPEDAKGKAASTPTDKVDESPKANADGTTGPAMQSGVTGS